MKAKYNWSRFINLNPCTTIRFSDISHNTSKTHDIDLKLFSRYKNCQASVKFQSGVSKSIFNQSIFRTPSELLLNDLASPMSDILQKWFLNYIDLSHTAEFKTKTPNNASKCRTTHGYMFRGCDHEPGPWFNIQMSPYQESKSHCGDKTVVRSTYL